MDALERIVEAVLYEGYILWPYRRSAKKNRQRWTFGGVYAPAFVAAADSGDVSCVQTQCLVTGEAPLVDVELRFLQVVQRRVAQVLARGALQFVDQLSAGSRRILAWDEAVERRIAGNGSFVVEAGEEREKVDGGVIVRNWEEARGKVDVDVEPVQHGVWRVSVVVSNTSRWNGTDRTLAQRHGLMSAHVVLRVRGGAFVSMTDPPSELDALVAACQNRGLWAGW